LAGLVAAALLAAASSASAGPWVKKAGEGYVKAGATWFEAQEGFNQGISTGLAYTGITYNIYGEIGLPGDLQLVADIPLVLATNQSSGGVNYHNSTFGDARFELDYALLPDLPLTVGLEAKVPLYTPLAEGDALRPYPRSTEKFPDAGDGNVDLTPKLLFGYSFHPVPAWATAELGYRARLGGFADGVHWSVGGGIFAVPDYLAFGVYTSGVINVQEDDDPAAQQTKEFSYGQVYALGKGLPFDPDLGLTLSVGRILHARNSSLGTDVSLGVSHGF
jgi:hypothetical protein